MDYNGAMKTTKENNMDYNNYYVVRVSIHQFEKPIHSTSTLLRFYDDDLKRSKFFNGNNFEDVISMKLAYDDDYSNYTIDNVMHISI